MGPFGELAQFDFAIDLGNVQRRFRSKPVAEILQKHPREVSFNLQGALDLRHPTECVHLMTSSDIRRQLDGIAASNDFVGDSAALTEAWNSAELGPEGIEPILRFMEDHPDIEYGVPGPLVHFVEAFCGVGYEAFLIDSVSKKPTAQTVWMLNRVINGTKDPQVRSSLLTTLRQVVANPLANRHTIDRANMFLDSDLD